MNEKLHVLDRWLVDSRPAFHAALRPGASKEALDQFAASIGQPLPASLRTLYGWRDGQTHGLLEGFDRFGMFEPLEHVLRTMRELDELAEAGDFPHELWWHSAWIPFLWSGGGSYLCVDLVGSFDGQPGQVLELVGDELERIIWFPNLEAWAATLVDSLRAGVLIVRDGDVLITDPDRYESFIARRHPGYPRVVPLVNPDEEEA